MTEKTLCPTVSEKVGFMPIDDRPPLRAGGAPVALGASRLYKLDGAPVEAMRREPEARRSRDPEGVVHGIPPAAAPAAPEPRRDRPAPRPAGRHRPNRHRRRPA